MKVLIAPDSFKGSLPAMDVAKSIEAGVSRTDPTTETLLIPMADGGEGTLESLVSATDGEYVETQVLDPLGREITGHYGIMGDGQTAVIELAIASGLPLLKDDELDAKVTTTYGTGQLIKHAIERGITSFIICLGGSSTNDAGTGILKALGYQFFDHHGNELPHGGLALQDLAYIDDNHVSEKVKEAKFQIACDVNNPFIGSNGASHIFGPQKGATPEEVKHLDHALEVFANVIAKQKGKRIHDVEGAGAAGGTSGGMISCLNAELRPGVDLVMETIGLSELIQKGDIDFVITGEGKLDYQTRFGKVVAGISKLAKPKEMPVIALCGEIEAGEYLGNELSVTSAFSITTGPMSLEGAMHNTRQLLEHSSEQVYRLLLAGARMNLATVKG